MYNSKNKFHICATCLSFRDYREFDSDFPLTEDIKRLLRGLLYDFDLDAFFRSKPPDKQLKVCKTCNITLQKITDFRKRVHKSFSEFMKYWSIDEEQTITGTFTAPSRSQTETVTQFDIKEIEMKLKYEEPDPLQIVQPDTELIENIKGETDISLSEESNIITEEFNEPEFITIKHEQQPTENYYPATPQSDTTNHTNNQKHKPRNDIVINKVTATSTNSNLVVPRNKLIHLVVDKVTAEPTNKNSCNIISNFENCSKAGPSIDKSIQNATTRVDNAATGIDDLENMIQSNLLFKNSECAISTNNEAMPNHTHSNITTTAISRISNKVVKTNSKYLDDTLFGNRDNIFERTSVVDGKVVLENKRTKVKVVEIDERGNIRKIGDGIINIKPVSKPTEDTSKVQQPSVANTNRASLPSNKSNPNTDIPQAVENDSGIRATDTSATESEEEFCFKKQPTASSLPKATKNWYINMVTRDEILAKMKEKRESANFLKAPYKCVSCVMMFLNQQLLETHNKTCHSEDSEFICFACDCTFKTINLLNIHFYTHTMDMCVFYCTTCEFQTKHVEFMKDHACINAGGKPWPPKDPNNMKISACKSLYYCPKCEYIGTRPGCMIFHYTKHHTKDIREVKCKECNKVYKTKSGLWCHVQTVHKGKKKSEEPVCCKLCDKWYETKSGYDYHMKYKHSKDSKFQCDECGREFTASGLEHHKEFHRAVNSGVKNHKCNVCGKAYYTQRVLRGHVQAHLDEKKRMNNERKRDHVCEVCGMAFYTKSMLKLHSAKHSDERPYKCSFCGDTFKYPAALRTHTKLKHKKNKNLELSKKNKSKDTPKKYKGKEKRRKEKRKKTKRKSRLESLSTEEEEITEFVEEELTGFAEESLNI